MAEKKRTSRHSPDTMHWTTTIPKSLYDKIVYLSDFEDRNKSAWFRVRIGPIIERLYNNVASYERDPQNWTPPGEEIFRELALVDTARAQTRQSEVAEPASDAIKTASRGRKLLFPSSTANNPPETLLKWISEQEIAIFSEMQQLAAKTSGHPDLVLEYWGRDWPFQATELIKFMDAYSVLWRARGKSQNAILSKVRQFAWEGDDSRPETGNSKSKSSRAAKG